jgi:L-lactate dehydrogenase complex protein LldG
MSARDEVLGRVRAALRDVPADERPEDVDVALPARGPRSVGDRVELFARRVEEYRATVHQVGHGEVPRMVAEVCAARAVHTLVVPEGLDDAWIPAGGPQVVRDAGLRAGDLDRYDGVLTGCALAIAETGTIVLDGGDASGRRAVSLVPDTHICVVRSDQVVASVPEAIEKLGDGVGRARRPLTFVSGPSATSDIEFRRVEGVHGPRNLHVVLLA